MGAEPEVARAPLHERMAPEELAALGRAVAEAMRAAERAEQEHDQEPEPELELERWEDDVDEPDVAPVRRRRDDVRWRAARLVGIAVLIVVGWRAASLEAAAVASGSMRPSLPEGSLLLSRPAAPDDLRLGDVVTFRSPTGGHRTTHRIVGLGRVDGQVVLRTKGDANAAADGFELRPTGPLPRTVAVVPVLGSLSAAAGSPLTRTGLLVAPCYAVAALLLAKIWSTPGPRRRPAAP